MAHEVIAGSPIDFSMAFIFSTSDLARVPPEGGSSIQL
jgi:hypothetical protein